MKEQVVPKIAELSREQSLALKANLEEVAVNYSDDERLMGEKSVAKAIEKHIKDLDEQKVATDKRIDGEIEKIRNAPTLEEKVALIEGMSPSDMSLLREAWGKKFKDAAGKPDDFDASMQRARSVNENYYDEDQKKRMVDAYLKGDFARGKAMEIAYLADGVTNARQEDRIVEIYSKASPRERAAIVAEFNKLADKPYTDFWDMASKELNAGAVGAMKALPVDAVAPSSALSQDAPTGSAQPEPGIPVKLSMEKIAGVMQEAIPEVIREVKELTPASTKEAIVDVLCKAGVIDGPIAKILIAIQGKPAMFDASVDKLAAELEKVLKERRAEFVAADAYANPDLRRAATDAAEVLAQRFGLATAAERDDAVEY
ncbi:MAG: hypothetical protein EBZ48_07870 [Proteobacteria bacterium]|nr:hypothetical protein [Pseudomonadota bacterium]